MGFGLRGGRIVGQWIDTIRRYSGCIGLNIGERSLSFVFASYNNCIQMNLPAKKVEGDCGRFQ